MLRIISFLLLMRAVLLMSGKTGGWWTTEAAEEAVSSTASTWLGFTLRMDYTMDNEARKDLKGLNSSLPLWISGTHKPGVQQGTSVVLERNAANQHAHSLHSGVIENSKPFCVHLQVSFPALLTTTNQNSPILIYEISVHKKQLSDWITSLYDE